MKNSKILSVLLVLIIHSSFFQGGQTDIGVDISVFEGTPDASFFSCLLNNGFTFAIFQAQQSNGIIADTVKSDIQTALSAGFSSIAVYIFPDSNQDPTTQIQNTINYLRSNNLQFSSAWLDIEAPNLFGSCSFNQNFLTTIRQTLESLNVSVGIYTSESQWDPIMCGDTSFSDLPLWYAHYDGSPSFSDFVPFGGWTSPSIKQYLGDTEECGVSIDWDYAETVPYSCDANEVNNCLKNGGGNACYVKYGCCNVAELNSCIKNGGGNACYTKYCHIPSIKNLTL